MNTFYFVSFETTDGYGDKLFRTFDSMYDAIHYILENLSNNELMLDKILEFNTGNGETKFLEPTFKNGRLELFEI